MKTIGIQELKERTGEVVRAVKEQGQPVEITDGGEPVAMIVPLNRASATEHDRSAIISSLDLLAAEIGKHALDKSDIAAEISDLRR